MCLGTNKWILAVYISETRHCYYNLYTTDCYSHLVCYTYNVSAATISGLLPAHFVADAKFPSPLNMDGEMRTGYLSDSNKGLSSEFS